MGNNGDNKLTEKEIYKLELPTSIKKDFEISGEVKVGKDKEGDFAECYRPIGVSQITSKAYLQCGLYYAGKDKGNFRVWLAGKKIRNRRKFEGVVSWPWWINNHNCGTIWVIYEVKKGELIVKNCAHEWVVDFD